MSIRLSLLLLETLVYGAMLLDDRIELLKCHFAAVEMEAHLFIESRTVEDEDDAQGIIHAGGYLVICSDGYEDHVVRLNRVIFGTNLNGATTLKYVEEFVRRQVVMKA